MRVRPLSLLFLLLVAVAATAPAGAAEQRTACQRLPAKGKDLAPANKVKLVRRKNRYGNDLKGCVLPDGKVRAVATYEDALPSYVDYRLRQVKGAVVLIDEVAVNQYFNSQDTSVVNIRTGRRYTIASDCGCNYDQGPVAHAAFVNAKGQAAAAVVDGAAPSSGPSSRARHAASRTVEIVGFTSQGERTVFDSGSTQEIPPESLALQSRQVTWTHTGEPRTARLSD